MRRALGLGRAGLARARASPASPWSPRQQSTSSSATTHETRESPFSPLRAAATISAGRLPASPGDHVRDVDTPALLVDLDVFERNCARLRHVMESQHPAVMVRPHVKAHKSPDVAKLQLRLLGPVASGVCCQKVVEAEAAAEGGLTDILLSNEVVAPRKVQRLAALSASGVKVAVCVDQVEALRTLDREAGRQGTSFDVLVDANVGQDRCGVDTPAQAVELARAAASLDNVRFAGLQSYHGGIQHVRDHADRAACVAKVVERTRAFLSALRGAGFACPWVTGGGSGTYALDAASGVFTEVQPGSFCFGDADYAKNTQADGSRAEWQQSLWVLTQVMSRNPGRGLAVVDAGTKAVSLDSGPPVLLADRHTGGYPVEFASGGDEHGKLLWPAAGTVSGLPPPEVPPVGELLWLQPGHCDPTVNLYDWLLAVRGDRVQAVWPVRARGPGH